MEEAFVLDGLRVKGVDEFRRGVFSEGAEPETVLQFGGMPAAVLLGGEIPIDGVRLRIHPGRSLRTNEQPPAALVSFVAEQVTSH
jgi:hypothetical protein